MIDDAQLQLGDAVPPPKSQPKTKIEISASPRLVMSRVRLRRSMHGAVAREGGEKGSHAEPSLSVVMTDIGWMQLVAQAAPGELEEDVFERRRVHL